MQGDLVEPAVAERMRRAEEGHDEALALGLGKLVPGQVGVVRATVVSIGLPRTFTRGSGSEGRLLRVALRDATGEADLVLWDDETRQVSAWQPGLHLVLRGATVKAGRGSAELGLGAARVEIAEPPTHVPLSGVLVALSPTRTVGEPPVVRFQAEAELAVAGGLATVVVEGDTVRHLRGIATGTPLEWPAVRPHPALEGWFIAPVGAHPASPQTAK